ncbi:serine O-acetyltransferase [Sphingobium phenoxybenzoativorans]|uniref:serine O-acetyltransferase n=1 Tax=Sphingobium phenoxybenzoativorans TaxID=1592790 RepID=UPI0009F2826C|nr:serine acetyltransferase [Sphingobium phenoxybenzoativorans]
MNNTKGHITTSRKDVAGSQQLSQLSSRHLRGCLPSLRSVYLHLKADLIRYQGEGRAKFIKHFLFTPGYKYTVWMRLTGWAHRSKLRKYTLGLPFKFVLRHLRYKYGIAIPEYTEIGPGFFINRFGGIYINGDAIIGNNVNIAQMSMIGQANRGTRAGSPIVGDRVYIGVGSALVGRISVGNDVIVGTGAVMSSDIPDMSVVSGNPGKILHSRGSAYYVNRLVPDELLEICRLSRER